MREDRCDDDHGDADDGQAEHAPDVAKLRWSGVGRSGVRPRSIATFPTSVAIPVDVTTATPRPRTTAVPAKTMFTRSPSSAAASSGA